MPFYLYTSNRLEKLAEAYAELIERVPLPPMQAETVILQSGGMARWLSMKLAARLGISANIDFPFPNAFTDRLFSKTIPEFAEAKKLDRRILHWQLMRILPGLLERQEFSTLKDYLAEGRGLKRYRLACRLADLFDQYTIFRPEMILDWEEGRDDSWQATLWRGLTEEDILANRARLLNRCLEALSRSDRSKESLPSRIIVFGLSSIPPYYLKLFHALASHVDVHIFFQNPCREYWGDIVPERVLDRLNEGGETEGHYLIQGNPILASTGQQGRELLNMLLEFDFAGELELFEEPGGQERKLSMLTAVQADILNLREGFPESGEKFERNDHSITVHSCHSPMRELEVLHDQLLAMFEKDPELRPHEIIVMTPDIEMYGPLIGVVFGSRKVCEGLPIPFSIADRTLRNEGKLFNAFLSILELAGSRLEISRVLAVIEKEPILRRFSLSLKELELIEKWLAAVNVRWGIDEDDRRRIDLPETGENTWRFGLDRLLLGYAMVGRNSRDFVGVLPWDHLEGGEVEVLGRFLDFSSELFACVRQLEGKKGLAGWSDLLQNILERFIEEEDEQDSEMRFIVDSLSGLKEAEINGDFAEEVEFDVIMAELEKFGRSDSLTSGFMAGGITFCEMLPMRAVPFKVVCLLGMNDNIFPRPATVPAFDLIGKNPRPGDRSRRKDDRYLFLEAILSARQNLYISYVGQSVRDGSESPPSVLVSELIEYLLRRFNFEKNRVLIVHPLQPFSPKYFSGDAELFSYSAGNFEAARALNGLRKGRVLVGGPLPLPENEFRQETLDGLVRFFSNPARFFCRKRLGIYLETTEAEVPEDTENFGLDSLDRYRLGETILHQRLTGEGEGDCLRIARQQGLLPHGSLASVSFTELLAGVDEVFGRLGITDKDDFKKLEGEIELGPYHVAGRLETSPESGQIIYRYAKIKAIDLVRGWLHHLFLSLLAPKDWSKITRVIGNDKEVFFQPIETAEEYLADIFVLYRQGMSYPLPFFPETSLEFAVATGSDLPDHLAMGKAERKWRGNLYSRGESDDRYRRLCYGRSDPLGHRFMEISRLFFEPLLAAGEMR